MKEAPKMVRVVLREDVLGYGKKDDLLHLEDSEARKLIGDGKARRGKQRVDYPYPLANHAAEIFFCYHRDDMPHATACMYERLTRRFGAPRVFRDTASIRLAEDFMERVSKAIEDCKVFLAHIGPAWSQRIQDPSDFVRREIEYVLEKQIPIIPVFVGGVSMPPENEMPQSLRALARRNGINIRPDSLSDDMDKLIQQIERLIKNDEALG